MNPSIKTFISKEQISQISRGTQQLNSPGADAKKDEKLLHTQQNIGNKPSSPSNQQPISQMPSYQPTQRQIKRPLDTHNEESMRDGYERVRNAHQMLVNQNMLESLEPTYSEQRSTNSAGLLTYKSERAHTYSSGFKGINTLGHPWRNMDGEFQ